MLNFLLSQLLVMSLFLVSSCGDLFMRKDSDVSFGQFATCAFDSEALARVLSKNIQGELNCLERNLLFFVDIVKSDAPGSLSEKELKAYIRVHLKEEIDEGTLTALSSIFDLSSVIFGDRKGYIKRRNVSELMGLLKEINVLFVDNNIHEYFTTSERISYLEHSRRKAIIFNTLLKVGNSLNSKLVKNKNTLDLNAFINYFNGIGEDQLLERAKTALFIKKAVIGGEENVLSYNDINTLSLILKDLSKIVYDFTNIFDVDVDPADDEDVINILKEDVETAAKNFYYRDQPDEKILTFAQLENLLDSFAPSIKPYLKYKKSLLKVKEILFGDNSDHFTAKDFNTFFQSVLLTNLERGVLFYRAYRENLELVDTDKPIDDSISNITTIGDTEEIYKNDFNRILKNYRFFRGERKTPLFDVKYNRNMRSLLEIAIIEDITNRIFKHYGKPISEGSDRYIINLDELNIILKDFETLILDLGWVYPGRLSSTANTITLMTSLFHNQSNGDGNIEVEEFVEFVITMLTSLDLSNTLYDGIQKYCKLDKHGSYNAQCFRDNFRTTLTDAKENDKISSTVAETVPLLNKYLNELSEIEYQSYMKRTATFSRACTNFKSDGLEVPMAKGDGLVSWAGLLAIEQTMIKFDKNKDDLLSPGELDGLYEVFKPALKGLIPVEFLKGKSKQFFQYIVKYKKIPDVSNITGLKSLLKAAKQGVHFAIFLYYPWYPRKADADRMTFAAVLQIIAENMPTEGEPFDCEILRN